MTIKIYYLVNKKYEYCWEIPINETDHVHIDGYLRVLNIHLIR